MMLVVLWLLFQISNLVVDCPVVVLFQISNLVVDCPVVCYFRLAT